MKTYENYVLLLEEIEKLKILYGIKYNIEVVVITKYASVEKVAELLKNAPVRHIGENYIQEAEKKFLELSKLGLLENVTKHMVGPVQSNKITKVIKLFDFVHSIENTKIPEALVKRGYSGKLLVEVKTSPEPTKHGIPLDKVEEIFEELLSKGIKISGLMTMAPYTKDERIISSCFRKLREAKERIENTFKIQLNYLSMGMSNDYQIAIREGANLLRIGSLIFQGQ